MKIDILLRKVLSQYGLDERGVVGTIARELGLHRHTVGRLYRNNAASPSIAVIQRLCGWLQTHGVPADTLPQALFGSRPDDLTEALAAPGKVCIYVGEYQQTEAEEIVVLWISRRDSTVAGEFVRTLSMPRELAARPVFTIRYVPFRYVTAGVRVNKRQFLRDQTRARQMYRQLLAERGSTSSILVGSQRVNYVVEFLVAGLFGCQAFRPILSEKRVPFYLGFRSKDRSVPSCFGGLRNPPGRHGRFSPGTYYLDRSGKWLHCPWKPESDDSGIVITCHEPGMGVQLVIFGFSGRATEALGRQLLTDAAPFWGSQVQSHGKRVGVYVCRFKKAIQTTPDAGEVIHAKQMEVIPIEKETLEAYLR